MDIFAVEIQLKGGRLSLVTFQDYGEYDSLLLDKLVCPCSAVCAVSMRVLQCQCGPRGFALVGMHVPVKFLLITISVYKIALQR